MCAGTSVYSASYGGSTVEIGPGMTALYSDMCMWPSCVVAPVYSIAQSLSVCCCYVM